MKKIKIIIGIVTMVAIYGCGGSGGSNGSSGSSGTDVFPAGKATLSFTAMSTAKLPASISGIDISLNLPVGMTVGTESGSSGVVSSASIASGSALSRTGLAYGTYSASSNKVHLIMATTSTTFRSGEFLRLTCSVAQNSNITLSNVKALNTPVRIVKAAGVDTMNNSFELTDKLKITVDALH